MHKQPPIEQTYLKVPCRSCNQVTPHVNHTDTLQCQVCFTSNFPLNAKVEHYDGWELASFWQKAFYTFMRPFGIASNVGVVELGNDALNAAYGYSGSAPVRVTQADKFPLTVNGTTHWLDKPAQKVFATGTIMQFGVPDEQADIVVRSAVPDKFKLAGYQVPPNIVKAIQYMEGEILNDFEKKNAPEPSPIIDRMQWTNDGGNYMALMDFSRGPDGYTRAHSASPLLWDRPGRPIPSFTLQVLTHEGWDLAHLGDTICKHADGSLSVTRQNSIDPNTIGTL